MTSARQSSHRLTKITQHVRLDIDSVSAHGHVNCHFPTPCLKFWENHPFFRRLYLGFAGRSSSPITPVAAGTVEDGEKSAKIESPAAARLPPAAIADHPTTCLAVEAEPGPIGGGTCPGAARGAAAGSCAFLS
ncbi:hypothetical protein B0T16DRAFT_48855 [Cercophora newfieldiana]|uniref:Uncharacterized protein n=1 Tax=Cercophora newfieldiana TaxID=92897 RepID=A0AA39YQQ7_9PEZI|nr:hypothetical protein B0T16DRAFT_48855 [Cercophora newfieldiana]